LYKSTDSGRVSVGRLSVSGALSESTVSTLRLLLFSFSVLILVISFQRKQYAAIEIVLTEKKGFGLRAAADFTKCVFPA
jgi:hypothetical protein